MSTRVYDRDKKTKFFVHSIKYENKRTDADLLRELFTLSLKPLHRETTDR